MKKIAYFFTLLTVLLVLINCAGEGILKPTQDTLTLAQNDVGTTGDISAVDEQERQKFLVEIGQVYDFIKQAYYKEIKDEDLYEGALIGLFGNLGDPYSAFISRKDAEVFFERIQGEFGGLGIFIDEGIDAETGIHFIKVVSPIEGTPAYYAGLRTGDLIMAVNEKSTAEMSSDNAVKIMRGEPNTKVTLTVKRQNRIFKVDIVREIIHTIDLRSAKIDDDIAYIYMLSFTEKTPDDFKKAIKSFKDDYTTLIVDVRNNPGGSLEAVLQVADYFFEEDTLLLGTESRIPSEQKEYKATGKLLVPKDKKLYVMVDGGSASASEIFAGAIKDNGRGTLVGAKTFGKGLVQTVRPYKGGVVKITIAQYYTPSGAHINQVGISPDVEIEGPEELSIEEALNAREVRDQDLVRLFLEEKKGILDEQSVEEFQQRLSDEGLTIENRDFIRKILFIGKRSYDNIMPAYSLETDDILRKTVEKIKNGEI